MEEKKICEMNIYEKMSAITTEMENVQKNLNVGTGNSSYKAVGEGDVLRTVKPLEEKYRVYSYPAKRSVIKDETLEKEKEYNGNKSVSISMFMRVETIYRFVNLDNPQEFVEVTTYGDGVDPQDKAPGKAMTYSDKYALLKAYKIETGDDPDKDASETYSRAVSNKSNEMDIALIDKLIELGQNPQAITTWAIGKNLDVNEAARRIIAKHEREDKGK